MLSMYCICQHYRQTSPTCLPEAHAAEASMVPGVEGEVGPLLAGLLLLLLLLLHHAPGGHAGVGVVVARPPAVCRVPCH